MLRLIRFVFRLFRSAIFLFLLAVGLGVALLQTSLSLASATAQVATLSANAATAAALHKKQLAKAISKEKLSQTSSAAIAGAWAPYSADQLATNISLY